jgi:hypothetical protein
LQFLQQFYIAKDLLEVLESESARRGVQAKLSRLSRLLDGPGLDSADDTAIHNALISSRAALEKFRQREGNLSSGDLCECLIEMGQLCALQGAASEGLLYFSKAFKHAEKNNQYARAWYALLGQLALEARMHRWADCVRSAERGGELLGHLTQPQLDHMMDLRLGEAAVLQEHFDEALKRLDGLSGQDAAGLEGKYLLARALRRLGRPLEHSVSVADIQRALEAAKDPTLAAKLQMLLSWAASPMPTPMVHPISPKAPTGQVSLEEIQAMKVVDLRSQLEALGQPSKGLKPALVERLWGVLQAKSAGPSEAKDAPSADALIHAFNQTRSTGCPIVHRETCMVLADCYANDPVEFVRFLHSGLGITARREFCDRLICHQRASANRYNIIYGHFLNIQF